MERIVRFFALFLFVLVFAGALWAADNDAQSAVVEFATGDNPAQEEEIVLPQMALNNPNIDPLKYTLGPDDTVEVTVMRHPEFSGIYPINLEGKLQYKFVGDIDVNGLTKKELEDKIKAVVSAFVVSPEVNVTVLEYKSKVIFVFGEVSQPGKYYMRSESVSVRDAVVQAGLPTQAAAMRKCRIITPDEKGKVKIKHINLYSILYGGDLRRNLDMRPGDILYVPSTVMAKLVRIINPVTAAVSGAAAGPSGASTSKTAITTLAK